MPPPVPGTAGSDFDSIVDSLLGVFANAFEEHTEDETVPSVVSTGAVDISDAPSLAIPSSQATLVEAAVTQEAEPPFLTDGRGRVVWSNNNNESRK